MQSPRSTQSGGKSGRQNIRTPTHFPPLLPTLMLFFPAVKKKLYFFQRRQALRADCKEIFKNISLKNNRDRTQTKSGL
jgi:hypothetical protein